MKNLFAALLIGFLATGTLYSQTLSPKKALKKSHALMEEGKIRESVSVLSRVVNKTGKYQFQIAVELAQLQAEILLLDSAKMSLNIAAKADDADIQNQVKTLNQQIEDSLSKYNFEIAMGKKYVQDRDFANAETSFTAALKYDTGNYQAWFGLGEVAHLSSSLSKGIELYYKASEKYTPSTMEKAHVYEHVSEAYIIQREFTQAVKICDSALAIAPKTIEAHYWKARALYLQRQFGNARESVTNYLEIELEDKLAWSLRGDCNYYLKLYANAIADFDEAIILDDKLVEAYNNRAMSYFYLEKYDSAIIDFEKLLSFNEGNFYAYNALGVIAYTQGDFKKAVDLFEKSTGITQIEQYVYNLTVGYYKNKQYDLALHHINNLTANNQNQLKYNIVKSNVLIEMKKYDEARKWLKKLTKANPYIKDYHLLDSKLYELQGDTKNATKSAKIAHHMKDINVSIAPVF